MEANRKITYKPTAAELKLPALVIWDNYYVDFTMGYTQYDPSKLFVTEHKIVRVNSDAGINEFNKVQVQLFDDDKLLTIKARTIMPDGTVHNLAEEQFKNLSNVETYGNFKVFALEGVVKGCELEYYYTVEKANPSAGIINLQSTTKIKEQSVTITYPNQLLVDAKSYNGFPDFKAVPDAFMKVRYANATDIPVPNTNEIFSPRWAGHSKVAYKITRNSDWPDEVQMDWNYALHYLYTNIYDDWEHPSVWLLPIAEELKSLSKEGQVIKLEAYLKEKYRFKTDPGWSKELSSATYVFNNNVGSELGLAKLYVAYLRDLKIPFEVVVTSNRFDTEFDPKFPDYNNIREIMISFPQFHKFVSPSFHQYRFGPPPAEFSANYAISISTSDSGAISLIAPLEASINKKMQSMDIHLHLDSMYASTSTKIKWIGYEGLLLRGKYQEASPNSRGDLLRYLATNGARYISIDDIKVTGENIDDSTFNRPFNLESEIRSADIMERAGKAMFVNIGKLLGNQIDLYNDSLRTNIVELEYPNTHQTMINLTIPKGYKLSGLDDLKTEKKYLIDGQTACMFSSGYILNGDQIHISITEQYNLIFYPKEGYKQFREVINAAADFGKVQLVLEKE